MPDRSDLKALQQKFLSFRLERAIGRLRSPISLMNTGAHPDDEHSALLAYLRFGLGMRIATLSSTRGQGGQNRIGPERGALLGLLRSKEMERAAKVLDADHYWLDRGQDDALTDFGFSKSGSDTLRRWGGKDAVVERMVRAYRHFRPDIILPTFLDVPGQHGHHRAMTEAALAALPLAADPTYLPDLPPWQIAKTYLPAWSGGGATYDDEVPPPEATLIQTAKGREPLTGASWTAIGEASRLCHATQDMGNPLAAEQLQWPLHLMGGGRESDIQDGLPARYGALSHAPEALSQFDTLIDNLADDPSRALIAGLKILQDMKTSTEFQRLHGHRIDYLKDALQQAILITKGLLPDDLAAERLEISEGKDLRRFASDITLVHPPLERDPLPSFHPIWRALGGNGNFYGLIEKNIEGVRYEAKLDFKDEPVYLPPNCHDQSFKPKIERVADKALERLTISAPMGEGALAREVGRLEDGSELSLFTPLRQAKLSLSITPAKGRVGYLAGTDDLTDFLPHIAPSVTIIPTAEDISLNAIDTLLIGVVGFGRHPILSQFLPEITQWVRAGSNLVTFYQRPDQGWPENGLGLDRLNIGIPSLRWRVTQPDAEVKVLRPDHLCFNHPNAISEEDWSDWNKERGLYFASKWGPYYQALINTSDKDEAPLFGSLLIGHFGKGRHIHCSLTLHHQITHLVPGAYRLLANLLHWPEQS